MRFRVNGTAVFCKGANWIPADALPSNESSHLVHLLTSAVEANMNMLRLWGGGHFESDLFYQLCDQLGILIYHDNMFSCSLYPSSKDFLDNVREEVTHQVLRLRDHACIALWCGDNECVGALDWFEESKQSRDRYIIGWSKLNGVLERVYTDFDPDRTFWPTSPSLGPSDFSDAWREDTKGDMHMWAVWHEDQSFDVYRTKRPRFVSEFGFQSFPCHVEDFCPPKHYSITSPTMEAHQRGGKGNARIIETTARYFRFPVGFFHTLYLSQLLQALAIETAVLFWRTLSTCAGTLFWQLNDCWPAASWSSVEFCGRWKSLMYHAKRFYAPLVLSIFTHNTNTNMNSSSSENIDDNELNIVVCSDGSGSSSTSFSVLCRLIDLKGGLLSSRRFEGTLAPRQPAVVVSQEPSKQWLQGASPTRRLLVCQLIVDGVVMQTQLHAFKEFKHLDLLEPDIEVVQVGEQKLQLRARAAPALFVFVEPDSPASRFSDNSIPILLPDEPVVLESSHPLISDPKRRVWHLQASSAGGL